jgi:uncharacterized membrane protein
MGNLFKVGRICYGLAMAGIGVVSMFYRALPYILSPPANLRPSLLVAIADIFGALLILTGTGIALNKQVRQLSLLLGWALLALGVFYCIPETLLASPHPLHFDEWENVEKVLALAAGAFVLAGRRSERPGAILFSLTIICFGILHFLVAVEAASYVPSWIPFHVFWMYFCGAALIASGVGIIFGIKLRLAAALLGLMILIWFAILHVPRVVVADAISLNSELTSAFFALAYSGTAWAISAYNIDKRPSKIGRRRAQ